MSRAGRIRAETLAATRSFLRRRTAVFFTFFFPLLLVLIFGVLVRTQPGGGGLFSQPDAYYLPGYLATVVLFTPLSRVGSEIARHRDGHRFEKLATTPLTRAEWLLAHTLVNVGVIGVASLLVFALVVLVTGATIPISADLLFLVPFIVVGVVLFCGVGSVLGRVSDTQDGVIAASNSIALPLLFLSDTFVSPELLPEWFLPAVNLSPLTYFSRGVRALTFATPESGGIAGLGATANLAILAALAGVAFAVGAAAVPRGE
ncbi:ABC transporter permease [Halobaculum halobium]|uniref:ABC transporter permease n=1 Tax=Halobaculum halobium TaxID=3032281 RepID=A0ABD5TA32_9EURY|nr:ABC transporter permease [Halobaculum sp. SYNS20]